MAKKKVVVTGMGVLSPVGNSTAEFWQALSEGRSGIGKITRFPADEQFSTRICGELKGFDPSQYIDKKEARRMDPFVQYAVAAATQAVKDAGINLDTVDKTRVGVVIGSGIGGLQTLENSHTVLLEKGASRMSPFTIPMLILNMGSAQVAIQFGFKGPNMAVATACATGNHSLGEARKMILNGEADVVIAGGTEATVTPFGIGGFCALKAMSTRNDEPARASRPFDLNRDGFVMGEGAGILVLESEEYAVARGARIYAELAGYATTSDAFHITAPAEDAEGTTRSMRLAIEDAGVVPSAIDYINAHGTSTPLNDKLETKAIKKVFGEHAYKLKVSSTKSMMGHLLGAAGGVEAIVSVLSIVNSAVPPPINYETPDPECDLNYVPNKMIRMPVNMALSNAMGFGGHNASVVFRKYAKQS